MSIKIFADGANLDGMLEMYESGLVQGFTTNPSLMRKGGVANYRDFASEVLGRIHDMPISFEVFADDLAGMEAEAREISSWAPNVFTKVPALTTKGEPTYDLIRRLSAEGVQLNVTAVYTSEQVDAIVGALDPEVDSYVSIFAGRLADAGNDPVPVVSHAVEVTSDRSLTEILWASTREAYNILQAEQLGAEIVTVPNDILAKWAKRGRTPYDLSLDTVRGFAKDIASLGFTILPE